MASQALRLKPQQPFLSNERYFDMVSRRCLQKTHPSYKGVRDYVNAQSVFKDGTTGIDDVC